jgi:hypothetical protein
MSKSILIAIAAVYLASQIASAQPLPPNTLPCEAFSKRPDGIWYPTKGAVTFELRQITRFTSTTQEVQVTTITLRDPVGPRMAIGGIDLYALLERKCGSP